MRTRSPINLCLVVAMSFLASSALAQVAASPSSATSPSATKKAVEEAQQRLQILGYEPGSVDGSMGSRTTAALKKFQSDRGLPLTGMLDRKTVDALSVSSPAKPTPLALALPATPGLVGSEDLLIKDASDGEYKGTISAASTAADCRSMRFSIDVTHAGSQPQGMGFGLFYPGITFRFGEHSCIPARATSFNAAYNVSATPGPGAGMGLVEGKLVSSGPMLLSGSVSMAMSASGAVIDFESSLSDPLVFQLTKGGYQYVSGTGSVKLPSGKVYTFPEK